MLLKMYIHFLEQEEITMEFEGKTIFSNALPHVPLFDQENIDTVSVLLLSHLDALYFDMLQTAKEREQDSHKWINPAFHIKGVWTEWPVARPRRPRRLDRERNNPVQAQIRPKLPAPSGRSQGTPTA